MNDGGSTVVLRAATPADVQDLAGVQLRSALVGFSHIFPETLPKPTQVSLEHEWSEPVAHPANRVLAATIADRIVAGVAFGPDLEEGKDTDCMLLKLYVDPDRFGEGIGSKLHDHVIASFVEQGYHKARLWVLEHNIRARAIYEQRGWVSRRWVRTDFPASGINEIGYSLDLTDR